MNKSHRRNIKRRELWAAVEAELGESVICKQCGTTLRRYADTCSAELMEQCEGLRRVDEVRKRPYVATTPHATVTACGREGGEV